MAPSGSQAKHCAIVWASADGGGVQNCAVMCNRPGSLGSGCQLGGVAVQVTSIVEPSAPVAAGLADQGWALAATCGCSTTRRPPL